MNINVITYSYTYFVSLYSSNKIASTKKKKEYSTRYIDSRVTIIVLHFDFARWFLNVLHSPLGSLVNQKTRSWQRYLPRAISNGCEISLARRAGRWTQVHRSSPRLPGRTLVSRGDSLIRSIFVPFAAAGCHRLLPRGSKVVATARNWPRPEEKKATRDVRDRARKWEARDASEERKGASERGQAKKKTRINLYLRKWEILMIRLLQW